MESEQTPQREEVEHHVTHSYQEDLEQAMNNTDATVVQELLENAREQEVMAVVEKEEEEERKWYSVSSFILVLLTLAVLAGGTYFYLHLTVKVQPPSSVGVFQTSNSIIASSTTLQQVLTQYTASTTLPVDKPTLINLVNSDSTLLSNSQLYAFIGAGSISEPLQSVISSARLGVVNTGKAVYPFLIMSVTDPTKASDEFTIAEPTLLQLFSPALNIDTTAEQNTEGLTFQSQYFYNLPVRVVENIDPATQQQNVVFLYGYATNNIIVITSQPEVLQAVYNNIIAEQ